MSKVSISAVLKERIGSSFNLEKKDLGNDSHLHKKGFHFYPECYEIKGLGHLCILKMKGMLGLMKMESIVLSITSKDVPLFNIDYVKAMGKETNIIELYNTNLEPYSEELLNKFASFKSHDNDLEEYVANERHWYDDLLYSCSYHKTGKKLTTRFSDVNSKYLDEFINQVNNMPVCDLIDKELKVEEFANKLYQEGGSAVNMFKKLFGDEVAKKMVVTYMYGMK